MSDYQFIPQLADLLPDIPDESIVSRSIMKEGGLDVTLFGFAAGQALTEHTASRPALLHFVDGRARVVLGGDEKMAEAGAWVYMPAHLPHAVHAETAVTMLLLLLPDA